MHGQAQDGAIDGGEAFESPIFRVLYDDFVEHGDFSRRALEQAIGEGAGGVGGFRGAPEFCFELGGVLLAHIPLKEHLHGELAGFGAQGGHVICVELSARREFS